MSSYLKDYAVQLHKSENTGSNTLFSAIYVAGYNELISTVYGTAHCDNLHSSLRERFTENFLK